MSHPVKLGRDPWLWLAFGFGSGLAPRAPGTVGTGAALLIYLLLPLPWPAYLLAVVVTAVAGIWICGQASIRLGVHDHGGIVWDEFVGLWITLFLVPRSWPWVVSGFLLFRLLDIVKPWPVRWADRHVSGGLGIMLDDVLAGVLGCLALHAVRLLLAA